MTDHHRGTRSFQRCPLPTAPGKRPLHASLPLLRYSCLPRLHRSLTHPCRPQELHSSPQWAPRLRPALSSSSGGDGSAEVPSPLPRWLRKAHSGAVRPDLQSSEITKCLPPTTHQPGSAPQLHAKRALNKRPPRKSYRSAAAEQELTEGTDQTDEHQSAQIGPSDVPQNKTGLRHSGNERMKQPGTETQVNDGGWERKRSPLFDSSVV